MTAARSALPCKHPKAKRLMLADVFGRGVALFVERCTLCKLERYAQKLLGGEARGPWSKFGVAAVDSTEALARAPRAWK